MEEVDQTSGHHTDHCPTPATKELLSTSEQRNVDNPVTSDLRPTATKRKGTVLYTHVRCTEVTAVAVLCVVPLS